MEQSSSMIQQIRSIDNPTQNTQPLDRQLWKLSLMALLYKNTTLYRKNYCSNICQILTPLLCLGFTLAVRAISQQITTGNVGSFPYPQPFHLPIVTKMIPGLNINCSQTYIYGFPPNDEGTKGNAQDLFGNVLKTYCSEGNKLVPQFLFSENPNSKIMDQLKITDQSKIQRGVDMHSTLPDGKIDIKNLNSTIFEATLSINDWRIPQYHKNNGVTKLDFHSKDQVIVTYLRVTQGLMSLVQKVTRSYLQLSHDQQIITGSFMYMPFDGVDRSLISKVTNVLGSGLYGLGLSLLLPIILFSIVSDKEERLIEIMKMNGLLMKYYWISFFIFNFMLSFLSCLFLFIAGKYWLNIEFFSSTSWQIVILLFVGWSVAQVSLTAFVQIFINSSKTATIVGYLLSIFSSLVGQAVSNVVYPYPIQMPFLLLFYPPWALTRGVYLIGFACANNSDCYQNIFHLTPQMYKIYFCLFSWMGVFVLSTYLHQMVDQQYGTSQIPGWLREIMGKVKEEESGDSMLMEMKEVEEKGEQEEENGQLMGKDQRLETKTKKSRQSKLDSSVTAMVEQTQQLSPSSRPLIIKQLHKTYDNGFQALRPSSLSLNQKQIFGLLGPNGAGKTTLMSVLTGLYKATGGVAYIDGSQIGQEGTNIRVGVCPQFDLLWDNMTISEHMYFYGLLKGLPLGQLEMQVSQLLRDVDLISERDLRSCQLSGGMRRRLSLAIALVGNPRVVFLDEPSSGLDPSHRRQMWDILLKCKRRTTILLTTHLMQQAEALCDRIGIINKGQLRCIGTQKQLKQRFGRGYRLTINFRQWKGQQNQKIKDLLGLGCQIVNDLSSRVMLKVPKGKILECVRRLKKEEGMSWMLSQPSLYDVFMYFVQ